VRSFEPLFDPQTFMLSSARSELGGRPRHCEQLNEDGTFSEVRIQISQWHAQVPTTQLMHCGQLRPCQNSRSRWFKYEIQCRGRILENAGNPAISMILGLLGNVHHYSWWDRSASWKVPIFIGLYENAAKRTGVRGNSKKLRLETVPKIAIEDHMKLPSARRNRTRKFRNL
jgi:hypothetical protein